MTHLLHSILKDDKRDGLTEAEYARRSDMICEQAEELAGVLQDSDATPQERQMAKQTHENPSAKRKSAR